MSYAEYIRDKFLPKVRAIISMPNDMVLECEVDRYVCTDYGLMTIVSGNVTYKTHITNVVIIEEVSK